MPMPMLALGCAFLLFGAVSVWEALRIGASLRARGTLDLIGPDRYLLGVAVLLLAVALLLIIQGARALRSARVARPAAARPAPAAPGNEHATADEPAGGAHAWLLGALVAYAILLPLLGYLVATLGFTTAAFRIMGTRHWGTTLIGAIVLTGLCYASFRWIAELPLPRGVLGLG